MTAASYDAIVNQKILAKPVIGRNFDQLKMALIETSTVAEQADTYTYDMSIMHGTTLLGVYTVVQSTADSILAANAITTTVSGTTITFTIPAAGGTKIRSTKIYFE